MRKQPVVDRVPRIVASSGATAAAPYTTSAAITRSNRPRREHSRSAELALHHNRSTLTLLPVVTAVHVGFSVSWFRACDL
jgi:hypothetical protein